MLPIRIMHGKQPSRLVRNGVTPNHVVRNIRKMIGNSSFNHKAEKICRKEERTWWVMSRTSRKKDGHAASRKNKQ